MTFRKSLICLFSINGQIRDFAPYFRVSYSEFSLYLIRSFWTLQWNSYQKWTLRDHVTLLKQGDVRSWALNVTLRIFTAFRTFHFWQIIKSFTVRILEYTAAVQKVDTPIFLMQRYVSNRVKILFLIITRLFVVMTLSNSVEPFTPKRNVIQLVFNKLELLSSEQATQLQIYGRLSATANLQRDRFPRYRSLWIRVQWKFQIQW